MTQIHIGTGQTRKQLKKEKSAEIELLTVDYLSNGGQVNSIEVRQSEFAPTWADYVTTAMESCDEEVHSL